MTDYIHAIVQFSQAHSNWVYAIAFAATFLESVAVVGFLVPGSGIIVALGALVPSGAVGFWWLCAWSILGALGGDGFSYWIGHHNGDRLKLIWPFSRHTEVLAIGERFFARHGGKSVFLSRFVAPVRGAVPLVAGLAHMKPTRFVAANVASALGWAPAHIVPGMLIGAGLTLTGAVATRLLVFSILLAGLLWFAVWLTAWAVRRGLPLLDRGQEGLYVWARDRDSWLARQMLPMVDPAHGEVRVLAGLGLVVIGSAWLFLGVMEDVVSGDPLVRADTAIFHLLQSLRNLFADRVMVAVTELGGTIVVTAVTSAVLFWLAFQRAWHTAAYWLAAVIGASLISLVIKVALHRTRPSPLYTGWEAFSFPSGHATVSAALYGFLAILLARGLTPSWQILIGASSALLVVSIGFSRLYLGAHWFSDVLGGIAFGSAWVAILSISYVRHDPPKLHSATLAAITVVTLAVVGGLYITHHMAADLKRYAVRTHVRVMAATGWWQQTVQGIPMQRVDLIGARKEPIDLQWGGTLTDLRKFLVDGDWKPAPAWSLSSTANWLGQAPDPMDTPVLPRLNDGRPAKLTLIHKVGGANAGTSRWVLRIWNANVKLNGPGGESRPLWLGAITLQHFGGFFAPFGVAFEQTPEAVPWMLLRQSLPTSGIAMRPVDGTGRMVMLAHDPANWNF